MLHQLSYQGFFNNYIALGKTGEQHLFVYPKNTLRLGDVYYGIVCSFNAQQRAYFVALGDFGDVYVKAKHMPEGIKSGDGIFVEIICEAIKTKPATGKYYTEETLKLNHYRTPILVKQLLEDKAANLSHLSAIEKFKAKKFEGRFYHTLDFLSLLNRQLNSEHITKNGAQLIIDELESLTAIDINAYAYKPSSTTENFALNLNKSCISDIFNLLNIRRISGTVVIDFLNMQKGQQQIFLDALRIHLADEHYSYLGLISIKGFTKTGLLELSIQKKYKSLWSSAVSKNGFGYQIKEELIVDLLIDKFIVEDLNEGKTAHILSVSPQMHKIISDKRAAFNAFVGDLTISVAKE